MSAKPEDCVFCQKTAARDDPAEHILLRGETAYVILNRYPYNNGHLLVVPYAHVPSLEDLPPATLQELMLLVNKSMAALRASMSPDGFNVGANLGKPAGAGIEQHVHMHVVPRWSADTNFMTVIGETRTVPETLGQTYQRLLGALHDLNRAEEDKAG